MDNAVSKVITAVLLDTRSIQKYVFGSNKLKLNIGASHLVENSCEEALQNALSRALGEKQDLDLNLNVWKENPEKIIISNPDGGNFEVGYIGGGNAILFFRNKDDAEKFVREWSLGLLHNSPGMESSVAMVRFPFEVFNNEDKYCDIARELHRNLGENKNRHYPVTFLPKHGITADCPETGYSAEAYDIGPDAVGRYISSIAAAKLKAADTAEKEITVKYKELLLDKYCFTSELDGQGQADEKSYLAVVHIDGNRMGERFMQAESLAAQRELSNSVAIATEESFRELIRYIIDDHMPKLLHERRSGDASSFRIGKHEGKSILPIRSIILNGDDITFVTDGRLGFHYAEKFLEYFTSKKVSDGIPLSACAGVAVVKTRYPFYRAYEMAEELCSSAKETARREEKDKGWQASSWIDFHISYGGISGSIKKIRERQFTTAEGNLNFGPYLVKALDSAGKTINSEQEERHVDNLKKGIRGFSYDGKTRWPRSKRKDLRQAITVHGGLKKFITESRARNLYLPAISDSVQYEEDGWCNGRTPYFDMLELMECYPDFCLKSTNKEVGI